MCSLSKNDLAALLFYSRSLQLQIIFTDCGNLGVPLCFFWQSGVHGEIFSSKTEGRNALVKTTLILSTFAILEFILVLIISYS